MLLQGLSTKPSEPGGMSAARISTGRSDALHNAMDQSVTTTLGEQPASQSQARGLSMAQWWTSLFSSHKQFLRSVQWQPRLTGKEIFTLIAKYVLAPASHLQLLPRKKFQAIHGCLNAICIHRFLNREQCNLLVFKYILKSQFLMLLPTLIHPYPITQQTRAERWEKHCLPFSSFPWE